MGNQPRSKGKIREPRGELSTGRATVRQKREEDRKEETEAE